MTAARKLGYRWRLREVMATRGLWSTTELAPLLVERGIVLSSTRRWCEVARHARRRLPGYECGSRSCRGARSVRSAKCAVGVVRHDYPLVFDREVQDLVIGRITEADVANRNGVVALGAGTFSHPRRHVRVDEEPHR